MKTLEKLRVAIYARVSTSDQHCRQQIEDLRAYAKARKWKVEGEYVDHGVSGRRNSRPALDRLMDAARKREIDCILVWKLDRWGRSVSHLVTSLQELSSLGVRFIATTQAIDTDHGSPLSRLLLHLLAAISEFERELAVERVRAGLAHARRQGRIGGRPRLVVDREKVRELHEGGQTMREIAAAMGISAAAVCRIVQAN
jgi:putative DNA-invertase from lambdoid prophage Rac